MSESSRSSKEPPVELEMPDGIEQAEQSVELVRAWIADGALMVSLNADAFGERVSDWGRLLSELTEHVAKATALQGHMSEAEAESIIRQTYTASGLVHGSQPRVRSSEGRILRTKH